MKAPKKKMQIEDLAQLIRKGFDELDTRAATRDQARKDEVGAAVGMADVSHDLMHILEWLEDLEMRIDALEDSHDPEAPRRD